MNSITDTPIGDCGEACRAIGAARTEGEVVAVVRGYLGGLDHSKLALPATLLSLQVNHSADIAAAAVELARHEVTGLQKGPEAALVKDLGTVLSTAAMRLAIISTQPSAFPT